MNRRETDVEDFLHMGGGDDYARWFLSGVEVAAMKYLKVEQMDQMEHRCKRSGYKKVLKRLSNRAMRRAVKADPENAPRKPRYRGWSF